MKQELTIVMKMLTCVALSKYSMSFRLILFQEEKHQVLTTFGWLETVSMQWNVPEM